MCFPSEVHDRCVMSVVEKPGIRTGSREEALDASIVTHAGVCLQALRDPVFPANSTTALHQLLHQRVFSHDPHPLLSQGR